MPAYGRDYRSRSEVESALLSGTDFVYANLESFKDSPWRSSRCAAFSVARSSWRGPEDFRDIDYAGLHASGSSPRDAVDELLSEH